MRLGKFFMLFHPFPRGQRQSADATMVAAAFPGHKLGKISPVLFFKKGDLVFRGMPRYADADITEEKRDLSWNLINCIRRRSPF